MIALSPLLPIIFFFFFFQAEDGIRDLTVTGVQTCALPIWSYSGRGRRVRYRADRIATRRIREVVRRCSGCEEGCAVAQPVRLDQIRQLLAEIGRASCRERV